jgi:hypothetical protein
MTVGLEFDPNLGPEPGSATSPGAPRLSTRRIWIARLLVLPLLGVVLPILLFELVLRAFGPIVPGSYQLGVLMIPNERYGHFHVANASAWYRTDEYLTHVRTNALGLRGPAIGRQPTPGRARILLAGDSFVEARQVAEHETTAALLGAAVGPTCEVVNAGVAGWGTGEEYVYLRDAGLSLRPNLVILVFFMGNDVANNARRANPGSGWHTGPGFRLQKDGSLAELDFDPTPEESALSLLLGRLSFAFTYVESGVLAKLGDQDDDDGRSGIVKRDLFSTRESSEVRRAWQLTEALLDNVSRTVTEAGSRLLLVAAPASYQVYPGEAQWLRSQAKSDRANGTSEVDMALKAPNRHLAEIAERLGVAYLDLLPALRAAAATSPRDRLYFESDAHWTAAGHRVAGRALATFLANVPGLAPTGCDAEATVAMGRAADEAGRSRHSPGRRTALTRKPWI